jgi:chromosome partitioning protein
MIVTLANWKGGVGKTTLAYHIAHYLAEVGEAVLAVDLDPQGSLTYTMTGEFSHGIVDLFLRGKPVSECVIRVKGRLALLGGSETTGDLRSWFQVTGRGFGALEKLRRLVPNRVWVVIDTSPSQAVNMEGEVMDPLNASALYQSDYVLCPVQPEQLSLVGLAVMVNSLNTLRRAGSQVQFMGVIPTMYDIRNAEHPMHLRRLLQLYGQLVFPGVPDAIDVARAPAYGEPVWTFARNGRAAVQLRGIGERIRAYGQADATGTS